jgi:predicted alpha/beta-hydrolase family hydrolase
VPNRFDIDTGATGVVTGLYYAAVKDEDEHISKRVTLILAHSAGASQLSPFMRQFSEGMARRGIDTVTFNFVYMERGRRAPDPKTRLEATYRAAIETTLATVTSATTRLVIGGKSMGGRIASQVAASNDASLDVHGLIFLGYPLHPPGRPERRRDAHLPSIAVPMLFVQGSRDTFGTRDEIQPVVDACQAARLHVVEGGDHSLKLRGEGAPAPEDVYSTVQNLMAEWIAAL